ncbi:MAG: PilT/PilU family type 4a pilus ATPase [Acidobacteriota bacterium]|nr:PilT/PilU family type 4a pilus ATPase [Acidobacteriota bacterium]
MELNELLMFMTKKGASDLHIKPMRPPLLRIQGRLIPIKANPLQPEEVEQMLGDILKPGQRARFDERQAVDMGYGVPGVARFRCNIFLQRGTMAAVFRRVPFEIQGVDALHLPDVISTFTEYTSGLVLVTGPTGSGKSTSLAAMINLIAKARQCHVVTIEDPIEFLFQDDKATISQREVGTDTPTFHEALRNCMRQDPDVIMVGEMRDLETMATAITAAETGHLVFSTLHTNNAAQTVDRIIDSYPADQQLQVRGQLALVLKAIVSMQLVQDHEGKNRLPACEILVNSPKVSKHIENGEIKEILEEMENSVNFYHMQSMNQSLISLLAHNKITYEQAVDSSSEPDDLSLKLREMFPSIEDRFREGEMAPSPADFSQITELLETKRLYEEMEERHQSKMQEKDEQIEALEADLTALREQVQETSGNTDDLRREAEIARSEVQRAREEAQQKINALNERIRELNQQIGEGGGGKGSSGFFKR